MEIEYEIDSQIDTMPFEIYKEKSNSQMKILDEMTKLDSEHKKILLDRFEKGSLAILPQFINKLFGVGA